jgi:hypothetical protein
MAERSFLSMLKFENLSREDKSKYTLTNRTHLVCRTFSNVDNATMEKEKFYLTHDSHILGAIKISYNGYIPEIDLHVFYIGARCTYETPGLEMPDKFATKGRLLWAYALNYVFTIAGPNSIIYNSALDEAIGYHLKMGMIPYNKTLFPEEFIPRVIIIDDKGIKENKKIMNKVHTLFYKLKDIDYSNIVTILLSLPEGTHEKPKSEFGGKRKTRRKSRKLK